MACRLPSLSLEQFGSRICPALTGRQEYIPPVQAIVQALQNTKGIELSVEASIRLFHQPAPTPAQNLSRCILNGYLRGVFESLQKFQCLQNRLTRPVALKMNLPEQSGKEAANLAVVVTKVLVVVTVVLAA